MDRNEGLHSYLSELTKNYILVEGARVNSASKVHKRLFLKKIEAYKEKSTIAFAFLVLNRIFLRFYRFVKYVWISHRPPSLTPLAFNRLNKIKPLRAYKIWIPTPKNPVQRLIAKGQN